MNISILLFSYGLFLIFCGVLAIIFIGFKAKTALASGSITGVAAMATGHAVNLHSEWASVLGIILTLGLFGVFAWRTTLTLNKVFELIPSSDPEVKSKTIAFLIIALMAVVSMVVALLQLVAYWS